MQYIRKHLSRLTERGWLMLLLTLSSGYLGAIATRLNYTCVTLVLVPWSFGLLYGALRRKELTFSAPMIALTGMTVAYVVSAAVNANADWQWVYIAWMLIVQTFLGMFVPKDIGLRGQRTELLTVGSAFVFAYLPLAIVAVYSVFSGKVICLPGIEAPVGLQVAGDVTGRISVMMHANLTARYALFSMLFSLYAILNCRGRAIRALHVLSMVANLIVLVHTQSRTCIIALAAGLGAIAFRCVWLKMGKRVWRVLPALAAAAVVCFGVLELLNGMFKLDVQLARFFVFGSEATEEVLTRADSMGQFDVMHSGRDAIWIPALRYILGDARRVLFGMGYAENMVEIIYQTDPTIYPGMHLHNSLLEGFARGGIFHVLFSVAFLCMLICPSVRMLLRREEGESRGMFLLPVFIGVMLCMSLTEEMLFTDISVANLLFFFICGHLLHADKGLRRQREK